MNNPIKRIEDYEHEHEKLEHATDSYPLWPQQALPPQFPTNPGQYSQSGQNFSQYPPQYPLQPQKKPWYKTNGGIIALLFLFFPVGIYLMWKCAKWPKNAKWIVTGMLALCTIYGGIANASGSTQQLAFLQPPVPTATQSPVPATTQPPVPTATQPPVPTTTQPPVPTVTQPPVPIAMQPIVPRLTQKPEPKAKPFLTPAPKPSPTATPTPEPTQLPVQQSQPPTGGNGDPWGYDFNCDLNSGFCDYSGCIITFWKSTNEYVIECGNGE